MHLITAMLDFFDNENQNYYVWFAWTIALVIMIINIVIPIVKRKHLESKIHHLTVKASFNNSKVEK